MTRAAARRHLEALGAAPRPAGGQAEAVAREYCAGLLASLGFSITNEPFEYSALPGRAGTPATGLGSILALAVAGHLAFHGAPGAAAVLLVSLGVLGAAGAAWAARRGVLALPWWRARSVNLVATRGVPRLWLMAHLDSKSQPVPILVRALGVTGSIVLWCVALGLLAWQLAGADVAWAWPWISAAGVVAGAPVAASIVRARSPGTLDNASGVATVLVAAEALAADCPIGIVFTSAEELGLAGARAWAHDRDAGIAINCDGVDDDGVLRLTYTGRRPARLLEVLGSAARADGDHAVARRLPPGVLVDGVALADAHWRVVTVSRGTIRTVARIHTPNDSLAAVEGDGCDRAAAVIVRAIEELV
jgi:acetylornithine deacetylase/succinyl-diaminopimelate desuccinylase-like protein